MSDVVRSAARVLDLLEYLSERDGAVTLAALTQAFGMPKSSMLGLLRTLCARGYVMRNPQGAYYMNPYFREHGFGWNGDRIARLCAMADPVMSALSEELGETVSLGLLMDDGNVKVLKQSLSSQPVRYEARENHIFPAFCAAMGRVLMSTLGDVDRERILGQQPFVAVTPLTVTDPARIREIIRQAGEDGYCVVEDESDLGGTGVAACLSSGPGRPLIALNISCISARFRAKREVVVAALLRETAALRTVIER